MKELQRLIDEYKKPTVSDWVYNVETWLNENNENTNESKQLIRQIKAHGDAFANCENLHSLLKQIYKKLFGKINPPKINKKENKCFVAMMFNDEQNEIYNQAIKPAIEECGLVPLKINDKKFVGTIVDEIEKEICQSVYIVADLTGGRAGVYYEAGIARGLMLCNHPIKLILTCNKTYFNQHGVHFDVNKDNILMYKDAVDYKTQLIELIKTLNSEGCGGLNAKIFSFD